MTTDQEIQKQDWPLWRKIIFRFLFIYLVLQISPWTWLDNVPYISYPNNYYYSTLDWAVNLANAKIFHIRPVLVPLNGSGDTSYGWTMLWLFLCLATVGCIIWSVLDRKRRNYDRLNYWLCLFARYYVCLFAFSYGILKLFAMQMYFPSLHQLATPLGDLLPMRLSWMFIGYSKTYQVFSGAMEVLAGLLLLNRRTVTAGILVATAVFANVMMLNLSYDIPVKIFSMQLTFVCLFLLANESGRLFNLLVLNKPAAGSHTYDFKYTRKWMRISRIVLKVVFIIITVVMGFYNDWNYYKTFHAAAAKSPVKNGVYEVTSFVVSKHSVPFSLRDTLRWQDVIFEDGNGSIKTADTSFRQRYGRGYFSYGFDKKLPVMHLKKLQTDSLSFLDLNYQLAGDSAIHLRFKKHNDSIYVDLKRINRHFQLAERQFHWLSEHNR